jgi:WD40 repeat protein
MTSWLKFLLLFSALLWLLAWQAIVWLVPVQPRVVLRTSERLMGFSSDGKTLVTINDRDAAHYPGVAFHLWDVRRGNDLGKFGLEEKNNLPPIVYSSERGWVDDTRSRIPQSALPSRALEPYSLYDRIAREHARAIEINPEEADDDPVVDLCFSTDGRILAYSAYNEGIGDLLVIDVPTREVQCHVKGGEFQGVILSPDGNSLATTEVERCGHDIEPVDVRLIVMDTTTGKMQTILDHSSGRAEHIVFSADGTKLAAYCEKSATESGPEVIDVRVWDLVTGNQTASFKGFQGFPEFLPDGKGLALCNFDGVGLCDLGTSREYVMAQIHPEFGPEMCRGIYRALFSIPNTRFLAIRRWRPPISGFLNQYGALLRIGWFKKREFDEDLVFVDIRTGEIVASMPWFRLRDPLISPDGKTLAFYSSENDESVVEVWDIPPRKPLRWMLGLLAIPSAATLITFKKCWKVRQRSLQLIA